MKATLNRRGLLAMAAVALLLAAWAALSVLNGWPPFARTGAPPRVLLVLDRSGNMAQPLTDGTGTKLQAAVEAIGRVVLPAPAVSSSQLGLREYGGSCAGPNTQLTVPLARNNGDAVRGALTSLRPSGDTTLVAGLQRAISDVAGSGASPAGPIEIVVITGGGDSCQAATTAAGLRAAMDQAGPTVKFRFLGIDVPPAERAALDNLVSAMGASPAFYARTQRDLEEALNKFVLDLQQSVDNGRSAHGPEGDRGRPEAAAPTAGPGSPGSDGTASGSGVTPAPLATPPAPTGISPTPTPIPVPTATPVATQAPTPTVAPTPAPVATPTPPPGPTRAPGSNRPPVLNAIGDQQVSQGQVLEIPFLATDPDGDAVEFTLITRLFPPFCALIRTDPGAAHLRCAPSSTDSGAFVFELTAEDNGTPSLSVSQSFTLRVR